MDTLFEKVSALYNSELYIILTGVSAVLLISLVIIIRRRKHYGFSEWYTQVTCEHCGKKFQDKIESVVKRKHVIRCPSCGKKTEVLQDQKILMKTMADEKLNKTIHDFLEKNPNSFKIDKLDEN